MNILTRQSLVFLFALTGCAGISDQDRLDVREAAFREFLPRLQENALVFIAFDHHDSLRWDAPPAGFIERLSGLNDRLTLRSVADMEMEHLFPKDRSTGQGGSLCSVGIVSTKGSDVTISVACTSGPLAGVGYRALMKKQKGQWVMIKKLSGWVS